MKYNVTVSNSYSMVLSVYNMGFAHIHTLK